MSIIDGEFGKILIPLPFNSDYKIPLGQALYFHNNYGSEITVLHVVNEVPFPDRWLFPGRLRQRRKKALKKLKRLVKGFYGDETIGNHVNFVVETGEIVSSILRVAKERRTDLIIIKKARRISGRGRPFKQNNADRLIANSACPVITIHKKPAINGIDRILLPVDITKKTDIKVAWAKSMAKRFGAEIHVVSVMNMKIKRVHSLSYQKGRRIEHEIRKDGIKAELVLLEKGDKPEEDQVLAYARHYRPDLMLIMTHQENILFDNYLGSFAREVIHRAKMPVFSVIPIRENLVTGIIESVAEKSSSGKTSTQARDEQIERQKYHRKKAIWEWM